VSDEEEVVSEFSKFVESVKAKIPIDELYTKLTGEQFTRVESRPRAKISWREDNSPSLCYVPDKNLLTDFTDKVDGSDKAGKSYNVIDILQKCGGAINFAHALQMACDIAQIEWPDTIKKKGNKDLGHLPYNIGSKIKEVWEACEKNMDFLINNPSRRPVGISKFFENRNMPFEADFIKPMQLGIVPKYDVVFNILKGQGILRKGNDNKELNIYRKDLEDNGLVYPLYNIDGGLCGLRFRQLDKKDFAEWIPVGHVCFYNGQRFKFHPQTRRNIIVEGEMNLVAYAIAVYRHLKKCNDPDFVKKFNDSLNIIFAMGSKGGSATIFKDQIQKVLYLPDHDLSEIDEDVSPKNHPILRTCARIAKEMNSDDLLITDWGKLPYVKEKFDLEDYLKQNEYQLESIASIGQISIARYAIEAIKKFCATIKNEDNRREVQIKYVLFVSEILQYSQREVFKELVKKEFAISDDVENNITSHQREVVVENYSIDALGHIIETKVNEDGSKQHFKATNFYMKINDETTYFSHTDNTSEKYYTVEIVINGKSAGSGEVLSDDIIDVRKMKAFLATKASLTDLIYYNNDLRETKFTKITSLMCSIPVSNKSYIFPSLGRPFQDFCMTYFKTELFCLFPKVSVINGAIKQNENFDVNLFGRDAVINNLPFELEVLNEEDYKKALDIFWYDLRHVHDSNVIDSLISLVFDSCTRELQGVGIVENDHGFPIYLAGQSGAYKTTAAVMAMSLLGRFKASNDLLGWNGTSLSLEHQLMKVGNLTHCIDDLKVEEMASKEFIEFIHKLYGGTTRTRMDSSATKIKGGNKLTCSAIITSETENENIPESIAARMLTLRVRRCSKEISAEREVHYRKMINFYDNNIINLDLMRGITPRMIVWAQKRGIIPYSTSLKKWKNVFVEILSDYKNNAERPSDMVARLVSAFEQVCEFMKHEGVTSSIEIDETFEKFVKYWKVQIKNQIVRIEKQSSTYKVIDMLCQIINSESIGIRVYNNERWQDPKRNFPNYPIKDITYPPTQHDPGGRKLLIVSANSVIKCMNMQIDNSHPIIIGKFTEDLKESGIIETNPDGSFKRYPIPNEKSNKIDWNKPVSALVMDYDKLMDTYDRIKND